MRASAAILSALGLLAWDPVGAALAQTPAAPNLDLGRHAEGGAVAAVMAAQDLFALATAQQDPLAALAAARIMAGIVLSPVARRPVDGKPEAPPDAAPNTPPFTADRMFDVASGLALQDGLTALIEAERSGHEDSATMVVEQAGSFVAAGGRDRWDLAFYAMELAEVAIVGPSGAVLDIKVMDADGQLICRQSGPRDRLYCPFVPAENGRFSVEVANPGTTGVAYVLMTN